MKIAVAADAPAEVRAAAKRLLDAVPSNALLSFLAGKNPPRELSDTNALATGSIGARAFDHLIVVGLPTDPLIVAGWAREAKFDNGGAYIFGYGHLAGTIGYVESDRNPFLHSRFVKRAEYETEITTLTGSTAPGVALAVDAFLKGLLNGVVAEPGWTRPQSNLLEHDPLPSGWTAPAGFPKQLGIWTLAGFTQASEDEYRGVEADTQVRPAEIWRAKYVRPGVWDGAGAQNSMENYSTGLHRRASVNSLWVAHFKSADQAKAAFPQICGRAQLRPIGRDVTHFKGKQPSGGWGDSMGDMEAWLKGDAVWMSTLPEGANPAGESGVALKSGSVR